VGEDDFNIILVDTLDASTQGPVIVEVRPPSDGGGRGTNPPRIRVQPDGSIAITLHGIPGASYRIQRSQSLEGGWVDVGLVNIGPNGTGTFTDETPPPGSSFYRLNN
jgi:hypothetical protein